MPNRQVNDEKALRSLVPFIEAMKASISMQKAVANHLVELEQLRAFGYSNGFISAVVSKESGRTVTAGLFASMMYRARMKKTGKPTKLDEVGKDVPTSQPIEKVTQKERKPVTPTELRNLRNEQEDWAALAEG
ncbi:hypothetical protein ACU680_27045 [Pseudomonas koreensis]